MPRIAPSRPDFGVLALLLAIGMVVAALAVAVLVTYHNGPAVLRLLGADRLQYDNAWVVLSIGLSLIMYALRMRALGRVCAGAASGAGAVLALASAGFACSLGGPRSRPQVGQCV